MRHTLLAVFAVVTTLGIVLVPHKAVAQWEPGIDRPGNDFTNIQLKPMPPLSLVTQEQVCDNRCASWTIVKAGDQGPLARCWLKVSVPAPKPCPACTSGLGSKSFAETGIDRRGSDFANFDLSSADPEQCQSACNGSQSCQAWTYVNPGIQGPKPRCWLKSVMPPAIINNCCVSGRTQTPPIVR